MAVLSDGDILKALNDRSLVIEGFNEEALTPNGYDVEIAEIRLPSGTTIGSPIQKTEANPVAAIPSLSWFAISTKEYFLFGPELCGSIWIKTSWARKGVLGAFGKIDAGFEGTLTLSAFNSSGSAIEIPAGKRFAQVIFERLTSPVQRPYAKRSGHYQGQRGVTLESRK